MADSGAEIVAETERLVLRRERPADFAVWLEHMNTPRVMDKLGGVQPRIKVAEAFARMAASRGDGQLPFVFVALKTDGTLIGKCGLARIAETRAPAAIRGQVQAGWTLRADYWGQGYAREAADKMLEIGFERFGLGAIYGQTSESNAASWRLMQRLGMVRRPEFDYVDPDYPPEHNPTMVWSIERSAWQAARLAAA